MLPWHTADPRRPKSLASIAYLPSAFPRPRLSPPWGVWVGGLKQLHEKPHVAPPFCRKGKCGVGRLAEDGPRLSGFGCSAVIKIRLYRGHGGYSCAGPRQQEDFIKVVGGWPGDLLPSFSPPCQGQAQIPRRANFSDGAPLPKAPPARGLVETPRGVPGISGGRAKTDASRILFFRLARDPQRGFAHGPLMARV